MAPELKKIAPDYDIIHVHHPDPMAALALYVSGYKGKVVLHWHSDILKQRHLVKFYKPLQQWLIRRADVIIGTSPEYIDHSPSLGVIKEKTACVPIGVESLNPDTEGADAIRKQFGNKKIVFFMGRLIEYKGLSHLVRAAAHMPDDYVVLIGGDGPLREELQSLIDTHHLGKKVFLLGRIPQEKVEAYYTACDVFCLPSVMKTEAFGIVQIEAMSLGKPVVATRIPGSGTAWVNKHGESGINVPVADPEALAKAVTDICTDAERYSRYCTDARRRFESLFTIDRMIENCIDIYNKLLSPTL